MKLLLLVLWFNKSDSKKQQKYFKSFFYFVFILCKAKQNIPWVQNISFYKHFQASFSIIFNKIKPRAQIDRISVFNVLCMQSQAAQLKIRAVPICAGGYFRLQPKIMVHSAKGKTYNTTYPKVFISYDVFNGLHGCHLLYAER